MDINLTFETSTTSIGFVSIDPGFVEKQEWDVPRSSDSASAEGKEQPVTPPKAPPNLGAVTSSGRAAPMHPDDADDTNDPGHAGLCCAFSSFLSWRSEAATQQGEGSF